MTVIKVQTKGKEQIVSITSLFHLTKENEPQAVFCPHDAAEEPSFHFLWNRMLQCSHNCTAQMESFNRHVHLTKVLRVK